MKKLLIINLLVMILFNFGHPVTPNLLIQKQIPTYFNGYLFGIMSFAMFIFSPFWGSLIDQKGIKNFLSIGVGFYGVMQLGFLFAPNVITMGITRFFAGMFSAAFNIGMTVLIYNSAQNSNKTKGLGLLMASNSLGGLIGQTISGYIAINLMYGIYLPFIIQFIGGIIMGVYLFYTIKEPKNKKKDNQKYSFKDMYIIVSKMKLFPLMFGIAFLSISYRMYVANIGVYVVDHLNGTPITVAFINNISFIINIIMNVFLINIFLKRTTPLKILSIEAIVGFIAMYIIVYIVPIKINTIIIPLIVFLMAVTIYRPMAQKIVLEKSKVNHGLLIGAINSANALGMIGGSFIAGYFYSLNPALPFIGILCSLLLSLGCFLWYKYVN